MADSSQDSSSVVLDLIRKGKSLFITGKAGTGKTTLLQKIYIEENHRITVAIVAPTGVAAKQAGGVTIHSLLHLPLTPYMPGMIIPKLYALQSESDKQTIREIDLLIIDEISMVRCDVLDAMDDVLRHYRKNNKPFGGIQVVMFGDLCQLMPVVTDEEWDDLRKYYKSQYFFSSDVYAKLQCQILELTHIYRQQDSDFIKILNHVRDGQLFPDEKKDLASRYRKNFKPQNDDGYIRLTTHNWMAWKYNKEQLESLDTNEYKYIGYREGFFPPHEYPAEKELILKKGARVMFVRNDSNGRFVNGTLGTITYLDSNNIIVKTDEGKEVEVTRQKWDFDKYKFNKQTKTLEIEHCGSFTQYPLKLAWCVTIHKSQGLTFDKVVVDAGRAFTYGQVYVALSRCRKFSGIILVSEIKDKNIKVDPVVTNFLKNADCIKLGTDVEKSDTAPNKSIPDNLRRTLWLVEEGLSLSEIINRSNEEEKIVYSHLAQLIELGRADVSKLLDNSRIEAIKKAINIVGDVSKLKEIRLHLPSDYKLAEIRMVTSSLKVANQQDKSLVKQEAQKGSEPTSKSNPVAANNYPNAWRLKRLKRMKTLYESGMSRDQLIKELQCNPRILIYQIKNYMGIEHPFEQPKKYSLTPQELSQLLSLVARNESPETIATKMHMDIYGVKKILRERNLVY